MATARESETDPSITSDDIDNSLLCQSCEYEGEQCIAVGFCVDCFEYLCQRCFDGHLIPSVTRRHVLLDKDNMPGLEDDNNTTESEANHRCQQHRDKDIEYHCSTHSFLGCHLCFYQHQKACKDVIFIQEVCSTTDWSEEVITVNQKLANITSKCTQLQMDIKHNLQNVISNHKEAITALHDFKQEVLDIIDKVEKEIENKAENVRKEETAKLNDLSKRVQTLATESQKMSATIEMLQNKEQTNDLYIELIQNKDKILRQEEQVHTMECEKQGSQFMFQANRELAEFLKSQNFLGRLGLNVIIEKMKHVRDISSKSANDSQDCMISGLVLLSDQKLIVIDWTNSTVKIIDVRQTKILSNLKLKNPWNICKLNDLLVAVTLPFGNKIVFLRTDPTLHVEREIKVNGEPRGIDYLDGKLVVSYGSTSYKVEIMDMEGIVLNAFDKDSNGQPLFEYPLYLAIHPRKKQIYISNRDINTVVCMKFDGTVVATYTDTELSFPMQVTFDSNGMVYVLGEKSNNVHQITEDCKKVKVILTSSDGLDSPWSMCCQENEGKFIIGHYKKGIKVYKGSLKYL